MSRIVTAVIATRVSGAPRASAGSSEIFWTMSSPSLTRPNTVNCPASAGCSVTQTKNCAPPLSGCPGRSAAPTAPRVNGSPLCSACSTPSPPDPDLRRLRRILRQRIAALDDAVAAPRDGSVVFAYAPSPRQLHEVADVIRREIRPEIDDERARGGVDHRLLAGHLRDRQRRFERAGGAGGATGRRCACADGKAVNADSSRAAKYIRSIIGRLGYGGPGGLVFRRKGGSHGIGFAEPAELACRSPDSRRSPWLRL